MIFVGMRSRTRDGPRKTQFEERPRRSVGGRTFAPLPHATTRLSEPIGLTRSAAPVSVVAAVLGDWVCLLRRTARDGRAASIEKGTANLSKGRTARQSCSRTPASLAMCASCSSRSPVIGAPPTAATSERKPRAMARLLDHRTRWPHRSASAQSTTPVTPPAIFHPVAPESW